MAAVSNIDKSLDQIIKENKKQIRLQVTRASRINKGQQNVGSKKTNSAKKTQKKARPGVVATGRATGIRLTVAGKKNLARNQRATKGNQKTTKQGNRPQTNRPLANRPLANRPFVGNKSGGNKTQNKRNNIQLYRTNQQQGNITPVRRQGQYKQPGGKQQQQSNNNQNKMKLQQNRRKQNRQAQMNTRRGIQQNAPAIPQNSFNRNINQRQSTPGVKKRLMRTQKWNPNQGTLRVDKVINKQRRWNQKAKPVQLKISVSNNTKGFGSLNDRFSSHTGHNRNRRTITFS